MSEAIKILKAHVTERHLNKALLNKKWLHCYIIFVSKANKILKVHGTERRFNKALPNDRCDHFYPSLIFEYDYENTLSLKHTKVFQGAELRNVLQAQLARVFVLAGLSYLVLYDTPAYWAQL